MLTLYPLTDAAKQLGLAASTLRLQVKLGKFAAQKVGDRWYVTANEIERYAKENQRKV